MPHDSELTHGCLTKQTLSPPKMASFRISLEQSQRSSAHFEVLVLVKMNTRFASSFVASFGRFQELSFEGSSALDPRIRVGLLMAKGGPQPIKRQKIHFSGSCKHAFQDPLSQCPQILGAKSPAVQTAAWSWVQRPRQTPTWTAPTAATASLPRPPPFFSFPAAEGLLFLSVFISQILGVSVDIH